MQHRNLIIVDTGMFSSFFEFHRFIQTQLKQNNFSDYIFLMNNTLCWGHIHFPEEINLNCPLVNYEKAIKQRLRKQPNAGLVYDNLEQEKKKRQLSRTEKQVANYLSQGASLHEISQLRGVTAKTIYRHMGSIRRKLGKLNQQSLVNCY